MVFLATNRTNFHEWGAALPDTEQHMPAGLWLRKRDARTTFQKFQSKRRLILFVFIRKVVVSMSHAVTPEHEGIMFSQRIKMSEVPKGKRVQARQDLGLQCRLLLGDLTFCSAIV